MFLAASTAGRRPRPYRAVPSDESIHNSVANYHELQVQVEDLDAKISGNGIAAKKELFDIRSLASVSIPMVALALAILAISPQTSIPWHLTVQSQLVVVGFLLSVMAIGMRTLLKSLFLVLEARFGPSRLQDYNSILMGEAFSMHTNLLWRFAIVTVTVLPIGLSVAYKRSLGGEANATLTLTFDGTYGISPPSVGALSGFHNAVPFYMDAYSQFVDTSTDGSSVPPLENIPYPYGFNILLLGNDTAATLDLPDAQYVVQMQESMILGETWTISASVGAYIAKFNYTIDAVRDSDVFWNDVFDWGVENQHPMFAYWMFSGELSLALMSTVPAPVGSASSMMGIYPNATADPIGQFVSASCQDAMMFRQYALMIDVVRQWCTAQWTLTKTNLTLNSGHCNNGIQMDSAILHDQLFAPFSMDAFPGFTPSVADFDKRAMGALPSPWFGPAYATATSTLWWARAAFMADDAIQQGYPDILYPPQNEHIVSHRPTLRASWALYGVIVAQPVICLFAFLVTITLYGVPVGGGFGLISLLAGVDVDSLDLLIGAGLSGKTARPITVAFHLETDERDIARVRYALTEGSSSSMTIKLSKDQVYG